MIGLYIAAAVIVGLAAGYGVLAKPSAPEFRSEQGVLDLTQVDVDKHPQKLAGEWAFYWHEQLSPEDFREHPNGFGQTERWIEIPGSWLGYRIDGKPLDGTGYATFRLDIRLGEQDRGKQLALRLPGIFHAYKLWVNGELLTQVGEVGREAASTTPQLATKLVFFEPEGDTVELVMQVANFDHHRGGITKFIELGGSEALTVRTQRNIAADMLVTAALLVIGGYNLLLFTLRRKDKAPLYFGLFAVMLGVRSLLNGELMLTQWFPQFPWELQFKIEYLILCLSGYVITMYFDSIFPNYVSLWFRWATRIATGAFCLLVIAAPAVVYTGWLIPIGVMVVLHMVYLMIGLVRMAIRGVERALTFLLVSAIALVTVVNDFLYYSGRSTIENTSPLGLLVFTLAQMILLSVRFARTAANEERISSELQEANDKLTELNLNLEKTVQERTRALSAAHDDLRASYDRLLHSEEGRKKLLAYITHDLRMPLASMLGYVEAVQDNVKPERNGQYLKYIQENTIRINRMIEELSFLSHLETGQVAYRMERVPLILFLRSFYEQYELVVRDAGLSFVLDLGNAEEDARYAPLVEMDTKKFEQALFNLVSNAMKFTARGGQIRIGLTVDADSVPPAATIRVQDSGMGIPPDQLERIFERNYRYDRPSLDKSIEGSGLGLAICREIVQAHGGAVRAESDGKSGATFRVSLPCVGSE